jgi:hypothetical protein
MNNFKLEDEEWVMVYRATFGKRFWNDGEVMAFKREVDYHMKGPVLGQEMIAGMRDLVCTSGEYGSKEALQQPSPYHMARAMRKKRKKGRNIE